MRLLIMFDMMTSYLILFVMVFHITCNQLNKKIPNTSNIKLDHL